MCNKVKLEDCNFFDLKYTSAKVTCPKCGADITLDLEQELHYMVDDPEPERYLARLTNIEAEVHEVCEACGKEMVFRVSISVEVVMTCW